MRSPSRNRERCGGHPALFPPQSGRVVLALHRGPRRRRTACLILGVHPASTRPSSRTSASPGNRSVKALDRRLLALIDVPAPCCLGSVRLIDGKNPNRFFPGNPNGAFSEVMDDAIFRTVIAPADVLIDLHGGDMVEALVPFDLQCQRQRRRRRAVGRAGTRSDSPTWLPRGHSPVASAAPPRRRGGGGHPQHHCRIWQLRTPDRARTQLMVDGIENALRLGMLEGEVRRHEPVEIEQFTWCDHRPRGCGTRRSRSARTSARGRTSAASAISTATPSPRSAPHDGVVLFITSAPRCRTTG